MRFEIQACSHFYAVSVRTDRRTDCPSNMFEHFNEKSENPVLIMRWGPAFLSYCLYWPTSLAGRSTITQERDTHRECPRHAQSLRSDCV